MSIVVTNRHRPPYYLYSARIGRPTALGNPYVIGRDGTRAEIIAKYAVWLDEQLRADTPARRYFTTIVARAKQAAALGKPFALECYCAPQPCHGDIIKARIEAEVQP